MVRPLRIEYPGAFYHITSRGNERQEIFKGVRDRERFLSYLESSKERYRAVFHVYCLMRNHYHLLLETPEGNLSQIMHHINTAYTTYFNKRHQRSGHLFQGRYKAILVDKDAYGVELSRYIHLNPVRAGIVNNPAEYPWSSYNYYIRKKRKVPGWLTLDFILGYFGESDSRACERYSQFVNVLIGQDYKSPLEGMVASTILGSVDFVEDIKAKFLQDKKPDRNLPALTELSRGPSIEKIVKEVTTIFDGDPNLARKAGIYLCHQYTGRPLREIGAHFGIGESAISQTSRRFHQSLERDSNLSRRIDQIKERLVVTVRSFRGDQELSNV